jgi:hypothetical protein
MGFMDDVRRMKAAAEAQPEGLSRKERVARAQEQLAAEDQHEFETQWAAPGWERPYIELFDVSGRTDIKAGRLSPVEAYLAIVGLGPEDVFGVWPTRHGEGGIYELAVAYRDRPEYAQGRERYAAWREQA